MYRRKVSPTSLTVLKLLCALILLLPPGLQAEEESAVVAVPYIEMRTGPGRGYPVFHVAEQGEQLLPDKRRTDWVRVTTTARRPVRGWIHVTDLAHLRSHEGEGLAGTANDRFDTRRWQWSASGGDFGGASAISTALAFRATRNIALEVQGTQVLGKFSDGWMASMVVRHTPFPDSRFSPYFQLGGGLLATKPFSTVARNADRKDNTLTVGGGLNIFLARRFMFVMDYRRHSVITSRDQLEEINEWKLGINVFF